MRRKALPPIRAGTALSLGRQSGTVQDEHARAGEAAATSCRRVSMMFPHHHKARSHYF